MRVVDWPAQLSFTIARHNTPFDWGLSDCMQLCMDVVEAVCGEHPYPEAKPSEGVARYINRHGAISVLKRHGFDNIVEAWSAKFPLVQVSLAQRADIGIVVINDILSSCVCEGLHFVGKAPGADKLVRVPRSLVSQAFKIA